MMMYANTFFTIERDVNKSEKKPALQKSQPATTIKDTYTSITRDDVELEILNFDKLIVNTVR
ncbi:hypothetical protein BVE84_05430 [Streptococcus azizii]|uniref:Uncharacterized protein n=1 Tax=Streptococcus azizii TaxID=1579424 RepID=A0AB36JNG6_9STRE|nr:hypothetical protein BVE86_09835 [Streptococcus azizii]ONK28229.1 hypothetical protein BVE85_05295 [Streptococcus azizii]ONK29033.1 hypothetical protein BVE84_05430 [Streptococcus azizii]